MKPCKQCGQPIGSDRRKDSLFCSNSCKAKYHELKTENQNYKGYLGSLKMQPKGSIKQADPQPEIPPAEELEELEPFRNILNGVDKPLSEPQKTIRKEIIVLPQQYITNQLSVPNPKYNAIKKELDEFRFMIQNNVARINWLNDQIQVENAKNGSGIYVTSGVAGAALGYWVMEDNNPNKKKIKPEDNTAKIVGSVVLGLFGLFIGNAIDSGVKPARDKQKAETIKKYKQEILKHQEYLAKLRPHEKALTIELAKHPEFLLEEQRSLNPAYTEALNKNVLQNSEVSTENGLAITLGGIKNPLETDKILSAQNMATQQIPLLNFKNKWLDFIGQPQTNFFMVVHGMSGEGKTHFTIQLAKYLAERFGNVLYVSGEEGFAPTMQKKIQDMGAMVPKLYVGDFRTGAELLKEVKNKYHFIIIDSINNMDIQPELMKAIRQRFKKSGFIAVCQSTKDDKIRGSYQIVHDSDITVKVNNGIAITTKNRFKQKGTEFDIFAAYNK